MSIAASKRAPDKALKTALLRWYRAHRRDLPWRKTRDPYAIWVSEIMLQQTRVAAVMDYYVRFLERFPTVKALAAADEQSVLAAWSGLGYYRRARMLHAAAKKITAELGGRVPKTREGLLILPGIGRYTSAAIASIAYGEPSAVVDGNVERVLERVDGKARSGEAVWQRAEELLDRENAGDWNQAMMELGATVCTPVNPSCGECPIRKWCALPGHDVRKAQPERRKRVSFYGLSVRGGKVGLVQRAASESLMAGMWELPPVDAACGGKVLANLRHSITDSDYAITIIELPARAAKKTKWFSRAELPSTALTGVARKALRKLGLL